MKKLFKGLLCVAVICGLMTGCGSKNYKHTLKVFNWGVYADMDVIKAFQDEYDIRWQPV